VQAHQEPVELRLRQRIGAAVLDRVLRGDDENGLGKGRVTPSAVTWNSAMHSSRDDWVLGLARLISSASTMLAKHGALAELELAVF